MKGSFTHITNEENQPPNKKKGLLVLKRRRTMWLQKKHIHGCSHHIWFNPLSPQSLSSPHSPKRVFFCGVGRGNNDTGALKDIQGAFTNH
jgi:hypothetical protein